MKEINNIAELEDKDLHDLIEEGQYLEKLLDGRGGDILRSATNRVIGRYEYQYIIAEEISEAEYKMAIKFYKYKLFEAFKHLIEDAEKADQELKRRKEANYGEPTSEQGNEQDS